MPSENINRKTKLINNIVRRAKKRFSGKKALNIECFVKYYYQHVPPRDILKNDVATLLDSALSVWQFATDRIPGKPKIRVYNSTADEKSLGKDRTIIEVINDNMPFLVDSIVSEMNRRELTVDISIHPIFQVRRNKDGKILEVSAADKPMSGAIVESFTHMEIVKQSSEDILLINDGIGEVLKDVRLAVGDWQAMRQQLQDISNELDVCPTNVAAEDANEVRDFLNWAGDNHFTFLGFREYVFTGDGAKTTVSVNKKSGLGILRHAERKVFTEFHNLGALSPDVRDFVNRPDLLMVTKADQVSTIHRSAYLDILGIKRFNAKGKVIGQRIFVGLFTSTAYSSSPWKIPLLRRKLQNTFNRAGFVKASHDGKILQHILETFPRDELFQVSEEHLYLTSLGILHLQDRQKVALFIRRDNFERFISCLVYIPSDVFTTSLRHKVQEILENAFAGKLSAFYTQLGGSALARLHLTIQTTPGNIPEYDADEIEKQLANTARSWSDRLREELVKVHGEKQGMVLYQRYYKAFRLGYTERFSIDMIIADIANVEDVLESGELAMMLYRPPNIHNSRMWLKVYNPKRAIPLSDILPMLEHMGLKVLDEGPHSVRPGMDFVMMHDFGLETSDGAEVDLAAVRDNFYKTFKRVWQGDVESDGFNVLVIRAGLAWREVVILRAYCKYLRQTGISCSQAYMEQTLATNPQLTRLIVDLFMIRFSLNRPKNANKKIAVIDEKLRKALDRVVSADEDRILRRFVNLVESTLRTNYFQAADDGAPKPYISFKLDSSKIDGLPLPRPMIEVFVYSPRVEAIHLRGGKVARGGIRWSDRREDFRTEILGLIKAQTVKNTVIIPVGSKGGFVVKRPPLGGGREAQVNEAIECYKTLMRGLLDITDNLSSSKLVPPRNVIRYDDDDPYLVVAADKGTATFSDIANGVSADYSFWLGDAFASGGSVGYDHKKMGITARGAWESVKRHFREIDVDIQNDDFSVIGVGDMSGDVFGNGMLLSKHIKLLAAFNHLHIFIDPNPETAKSFAERKRLFALPRSSWNNYDAKLISKGGGVFERSAKSITLSPEIMKCFAITNSKTTPNELLSAILSASVDLLWFGGIGTYIKGSNENHIDAGDRSNDAIRINAADLRCKVIGEGANMGMTQRSRIEFALNGGRLNTDFIDNSAGVDCSDNEVNIKILLDQVVAKTSMTTKKRNVLLASMTDEVATLVLKDNYAQPQAITMIQTEGMQVFDNQVRLMRMLERIGRLNRAVEFLPDDETLAEREAANQGLVRPEIAVLMSYAKIWLYDELLNSDLPDDAILFDELINYFPTPLKKKYKDMIACHRLRREIIATKITNSMINRVGGTFVHHFMEKTGMAPSDIARAYTIARHILALRDLWDDIDALDNKVPANVQTAMLLDVSYLIEWVTLWFLRNGDRPLNIGVQSARFSQGFADLIAGLNSLIPRQYRADVKKRAKPYIDQGVPEKLALKVSGLVNLLSGCDIVQLALKRRLTVSAVAKLYFAVGTRFRLGRLRAAAEKLNTESHWQKLAVAAMIEEIYGHQLALTSQVLDFSNNEIDSKKAMDIWLEKNATAIKQTEQLLAELWSTEINDLAMITVASGQLRALSETSAPSTAQRNS